MSERILSILEEYLISWRSGKSPKLIEKELKSRKGIGAKTASDARKIFEKWIDTKEQDWKKIKTMLK